MKANVAETTNVATENVNPENSTNEKIIEDAKKVTGNASVENKTKRKYTKHEKPQEPSKNTEKPTKQTENKKQSKEQPKEQPKGSVKPVVKMQEKAPAPEKKNQTEKNVNVQKENKTPKAEVPAEKTEVFLIKDILAGVDLNQADKLEWWNNVPKKERFVSGDVVYFTEVEKFGYFVKPARKAGLLQIRILKQGTKEEVYTRDWFVSFDNVELVKRDNVVKRGFSETEKEFIVKGGKKID